MNANEEEQEDVVAKSFTHIFQLLSNGDVADEASQKFRELTRALQAWAADHNKSAKGEIVIKLKLTTDPTDLTKVDHDITIKKPKKAPKSSNLWLDMSGNLVPQDPRQQLIPGVRLVAGKAAADRAAEAKQV